jgi:hypothetical protein
VDKSSVDPTVIMSMEYIIQLSRIMAIVCCLFGLPGNILTIIVCMKSLCHRTINFERKVFDLFLAEISILGKKKNRKLFINTLRNKNKE